MKFLSLIVALFIFAAAYASAPISANAAGVSLTTTLTDGAVQRGSKKTFDVWARNADDEKIASSVTLNGKAVPCNWDDTDKTSYTLTFTKEGENTVKVSAASAELTYKIIYKKAEKGNVIGTSTWSIELFTIGCGYLVKPVKVTLYEGENAADALLRIIGENGFAAYCGGSPEASFYLAYIADGNKTEKNYNGYALSPCPSGFKKLDLSPSVPAVLYPYLEETMSFFDENDYSENWNGYIGEFVISNGSGWMYSVNNVFPNVGFCDSYLSDGDVVRVQFTLAYGADIGGSSAMGTNDPSMPDGFYEVTSKDKLTALLAEASAAKAGAAYTSAINAVQKVNASKAELDAAYQNLTSAMRGTTPETTVTETVRQTPTATTKKNTTASLPLAEESESVSPSEESATALASASDPAEMSTENEGGDEQGLHGEKRMSGIYIAVAAVIFVAVAATAAVYYAKRRK